MSQKLRRGGKAKREGRSVVRTLGGQLGRWVGDLGEVSR